MKRKLDEDDQPAAASAAGTEDEIDKSDNLEPSQPSQPAEPTFADLGLDPRLLQAIAQLDYKKPTLIQQKAIPLANGGQDVLARAKTGSGKTAAYLLPVLQSCLKHKQADPSARTAALILVPTRELASQIFRVIGELAAFCAKDVQAVNLAEKLSDTVQRSLLANAPDIVVATPTKALQSVNASSLSLERLSHLVLDEADLVSSYGYGDDLENLARSLPKGVQTILMSATLTTEVDSLKGIFCRNPALLDLEEPDEEGEGVTQYVIKCAEEEKFLLAYIMFKLRLIKGKCIIFVADVDRCYRLKLFFEQFGIRSCVLNPELPANSRIHVVEEFSRNVYDIIIASDETEVLGDEDQQGEEEAATAKEEADKNKDNNDGRPKKKIRPSKKDKSYGVARGIDFRKVAVVINFDLPTTSRSYLHRIGRTARAGQRGMALSFVIPKENYRKHPPTSVESTKDDEKVMERIVRQQAKRGKEVHDYQLDMKQVEAFRYRMTDALRAVTKVAIREARTREFRQELVKSEKLKRHFEENPAELRHLRHDGELRASRTQAHLKHVPDYLLPREGGVEALAAEDVGFVPLRKHDKNRRSGHFGKTRGKGFKAGGKRSNPLRTFKAKRKTK